MKNGLNLPSEVRRFLAEHYSAGIKMAVSCYRNGAADEDSLTGALGMAITTPAPVVVQTSGAPCIVQVSYNKVRGRGQGALEKLTGADGIFQIEYTQAGGTSVVKGLPFQSKTGWNTENKSLKNQAEKLIHTFGDGLIIDYRGSGYSACTAKEVVSANGSRRIADENKFMLPLADQLGGAFLLCKIGRTGLYYDHETKNFRSRVLQFMTRDEDNDAFSVISTTVKASD